MFIDGEQKKCAFETKNSGENFVWHLLHGIVSHNFICVTDFLSRYKKMFMDCEQKEQK